MLRPAQNLMNQPVNQAISTNQTNNEQTIIFSKIYICIGHPPWTTFLRKLNFNSAWYSWLSIMLYELCRELTSFVLVEDNCICKEKMFHFWKTFIIIHHLWTHWLHHLMTLMINFLNQIQWTLIDLIIKTIETFKTIRNKRIYGFQMFLFNLLISFTIKNNKKSKSMEMHRFAS